MPPKARFTRQEIVQTAFDMTREIGFGAVTARALGKQLGTSVTPIFTAFENMYDLRQEVRKLAMCEFENYVADALNYTPAFKQFGIQMIRFANEEPQLFRILYLDVNEQSRSFDEMRKELGRSATVCTDVIQKDYSLSEEDAKKLFQQMWIYTFSICVLVVNRICHFSSEEITDMLSMEFQGTLMLLREGKYKRTDVVLKSD